MRKLFTLEQDSEVIKIAVAVKQRQLLRILVKDLENKAGHIMSLFKMHP